MRSCQMTDKLLSVKLMTLIFVSLAVTFPERTNSAFSRTERSFLDLCTVVNTHTRRACLDYLGYGCFCGLGGQGQPLDDVDKCCQAHDDCYGRHRQCVAYFQTINMDCKDGKCTCTDPKTSGCPYNVCQCDVQFGACLNTATFNKDYANYDKDKCIS
ncbi:acidic phospholipase A2 E-like isoform X3 [Biomphalaria glabrata]|uniref:Phospholipase A2 n=1 Tax=Biomphalaria glabrata TaxID=6526 RepID=A0A9W3AYX2_BIOGL|nr:acidic phospholipase A2 E-like isoform X3 [Biomphalaria glabrata]